MSANADTDRRHQVKPELEHLLVSVGDLHNHPTNPRRGDVDAIAESLTRFGQMRPVIATTDGTIVAGNHTYRAALKLGWTHIAATLMVMSQADVDAYLIADNRHSDVATYDDGQLLDHLRLLAESDNLMGVGYSMDDLAELSDLVANGGDPSDLDDPADPDDPDPDGDDGDDTPRGVNLALIDVSIADPKTELGKGAFVRLGRHYLLVESVFKGHADWGQLLEADPDRLFVPYPMPTLPLTIRAEQETLVMVQPDPYLAGHMVDKYVSVKGDDQVEIVRYKRA